MRILRYQVLSQRFGNRMRSIARAELDLRFFQVATDCFLSKPESFGSVTGLITNRYQAQNR